MNFWSSDEYAIQSKYAWRYRLFGAVPAAAGIFMFSAILAVIIPLGELTSLIVVMILFPIWTIAAIVWMPYAVYAIEKQSSFLLGDSIFILAWPIFLMGKLLKYAVAGTLFFIFAPIGMQIIKRENAEAIAQQAAI